MFNLIKTVQILYKTTGRSLLGLQSFTRKSHASNITYSGSMKVTILGGAGNVGQALSLMLKQSPLIDELCIYDIKNTAGLAAELNHVDTNCKVIGYTGQDCIGEALKHSKLVVILASAPVGGSLDPKNIFEPNAKIVQELLNDFADYSPKALLAIATEPINSMIPMSCEILKKAGVYNPNTIFGITTLASVRANTFAARVLGVDPENVLVPLIGGNTEETIIPVLSNTKPTSEYTNEELENITLNVKKANEQMANMKSSENSPLACAFGCARFVISLIKAMKGYEDIVECAYVPSKIHPDAKYLATPLLLGPNGILKNLGIPSLTEYESCLLDNAINPLMDDIEKGEKFAGVQEQETVCDPRVRYDSR